MDRDSSCCPSFQFRRRWLCVLNILQNSASCSISKNNSLPAPISPEVCIRIEQVFFRETLFSRTAASFFSDRLMDNQCLYLETYVNVMRVVLSVVKITFLNFFWENKSFYLLWRYSASLPLQPSIKTKPLPEDARCSALCSPPRLRWEWLEFLPRELYSSNNKLYNPSYLL